MAQLAEVCDAIKRAKRDPDAQFIVNPVDGRKIAVWSDDFKQIQWGCKNGKRGRQGCIDVVRYGVDPDDEDGSGFKSDAASMRRKRNIILGCRSAATKRIRVFTNKPNGYIYCICSHPSTACAWWCCGASGGSVCSQSHRSRSPLDMLHGWHAGTTHTPPRDLGTTCSRVIWPHAPQ